jgi:hypothetical protein
LHWCPKWSIRTWVSSQASICMACCRLLRSFRLIYARAHTHTHLWKRKKLHACWRRSFHVWRVKEHAMARTEAVSATIRAGFREGGAGPNFGADFYRTGQTHMWFSFTAPGMRLEWSRIFAWWFHFVGSGPTSKNQTLKNVCAVVLWLGWAARSASKHYTVSQHVHDFGLISL